VCHRLDLARLAQLYPTGISHIQVPIQPLQLLWDGVRASDKTRRKNEKPKPNAKRKTMSPAGADHQNSQAPPTPGLNTDSAGNLPNHQLTAWNRIPHGARRANRFTERVTVAGGGGSANDQEHCNLVSLDSSCSFSLNGVPLAQVECTTAVSPSDQLHDPTSNERTVFVGDCPDREQLTQGQLICHLSKQ
jgi:hypothetical protein